MFSPITYTWFFLVVILTSSTLLPGAIFCCGLPSHPNVALVIEGKGGL